MKITFSKRFSDTLHTYMKSAEKRTLDRTREMARYALMWAAEHSPQYTGTYASNWRLSVERSTPGNNKRKTQKWVPRVGKQNQNLERWQRIIGDAYQEGDNPAVTRAVNSLGNKLSTLRLGQRVFLATSATNEDGEHYEWDIEAGLIRFRAVNPTARENKGKVLQKAIQAMKARYQGAIK